MTNFILNTDSYKASHYLQYPPGTEEISSYIESRGGAFPNTLFFGLQAFIQDYLMKPITYGDVMEAGEVIEAHGLPFNRDGWLRIVNAHGGRLPLEISAVPEGTVLPTNNVLVQVRNTDRSMPWLTSYVETALLRGVWYPTTVATLSYAAKRLIQRWLVETSDDSDGQLPYKLHDFGGRGVSSCESAALGGMAHLVNFRGTDTLPAILAARHYYECTMAGTSIPAAEHSTITSWERHGEKAAYANMLEKFALPGKMVAVVSDSYDIYHAVDTLWGKNLRERVVNSGATVVIRPDSGDPKVVVVNILRSLAANFGATANSKGYDVLNPCIRVIQGDGMDLWMIDEVCRAVSMAKFSIDNIAFGMGGALLQKVDRDTQRWAMKASAVKVNGLWHDVYKDPITDPGKQSKRGVLALVQQDGKWATIRRAEAGKLGLKDHLVPVYRDGQILSRTTLDEIRARTAL